ncbi:MAG: beta-lactamase family protein [Marinibacterium sp.]|nr:beta-lactamase family protein [Marinibacterium sp.]
MRTFGKWLGRILLALALAVLVVGVWKREELTRLRAVMTLFDEDRIVGNFSNMGAAFLTTDMPRGDGPASPLPQGDPITLPDGTDDWLAERSVTSLLVLKDGQIVFEDYYQGTSPDDLRISWSVAKSYLSALTGVLLAEGAIDSLDDPVTKYAPALAGTGYDGASIRNVLNMSSGLVFDEDYFDFNSDINRMGRVVALGQTLDGFAAGYTETFAAPGTEWQYVSLDTHVIGMVLRGATGRDIPELLNEKILLPLGLEQDATYLTDGAGVAFVLAGLNFTTRDFARFGRMVEQDGMQGDQRVLPEGWVAASTAPSAPTEPGKIGYGYQWWIPADAGEFMGRGIYGQYLYIDQERDLVIVLTAADRAFRQPGVGESYIDTLRRIGDAATKGS